MRHTVLIIDDDPLLVTLQKKLTQRIGPVDVAHADDGFQALHFLAEIEPDIGQGHPARAATDECLAAVRINSRRHVASRKLDVHIDDDRCGLVETRQRCRCKHRNCRG